MDIQMFLTLWGAGLATVLGIIKFIEFRKTRFLIKVKHRTEFGNDVYDIIDVYNASHIDAQVMHWNLFWGRKVLFWITEREQVNLFDDGGIYEFKISSNNSFSLSFEEPYTIPKPKGKHNQLYIELNFARQGKKTFRVY